MSGEGHPADCPDCTQCVECESRAAWCVSEHPIAHPCPHLEPICGDCLTDTCVPCRLAAEADMFTTGTYSEAADPFFNHLAKQTDRTEEAGGYWKYGDVWVPNNPKESA